jgi:hypothetical protein
MAGFAFRERIRVKQKTEGPHWAGLLRVSFGNLKLRVGPPEIGVIVRAIIVVASQHKAPRGRRGGGLEAGNH